MQEKFETPNYYRTVMPYLVLKDVGSFLTFINQVFDIEIKMKYRGEGGRIKHAEVVIGDSTIMMGESTDEWKVQNAGLYINVDNADTTFQKALDAGASEIMDLSNQEYGRSCGIQDPSGNTWWITSPLQ
ncbi:VOC family protein [Membranihabitans maritimus]|uniref:VOC family protein n=1 Tax=Membranihabitans maritimus TaxID=2904244 RepID=UPI001F3CA263|nr:VOC family protein [Membranihabitans maritimus]